MWPTMNEFMNPGFYSYVNNFAAVRLFFLIHNDLVGHSCHHSLSLPYGMLKGLKGQI